MRATLPGWLAPWCLRELGAAPAELLLSAAAVSDVLALRLEDGRTVVVKARENEAGRARACVEAQRALTENGFPCARPLTAVTAVAELAVHAEEWLPGGEQSRTDDAETAARSARLLADVIRRLARIDAAPPLPNPEWVRWEHEGPDLFPPNPRHDERAAAVELPAFVERTARRARERLLRTGQPCVLGHADWEAQNLRWTGGRAHAVHDWDSLAWLPEAALVGAAAGAFASAEVPTLAPVASSAVFLDAYEEARGSALARDERELAWAASLWPALHNARGEVLYDQPPVAGTALAEQADERLALAAA